jgi:hypothetical protein
MTLTSSSNFPRDLCAQRRDCVRIPYLRDEGSRASAAQAPRSKGRLRCELQETNTLGWMEPINGDCAIDEPRARTHGRHAVRRRIHHRWLPCPSRALTSAISRRRPSQPRADVVGLREMTEVYLGAFDIWITSVFIDLELRRRKASSPPAGTGSTLPVTSSSTPC